MTMYLSVGFWVSAAGIGPDIDPLDVGIEIDPDRKWESVDHAAHSLVVPAHDPHAVVRSICVNDPVTSGRDEGLRIGAGRVDKRPFTDFVKRIQAHQ